LDYSSQVNIITRVQERDRHRHTDRQAAVFEDGKMGQEPRNVSRKRQGNKFSPWTLRKNVALWIHFRLLASRTIR
jgi:hypothetical protein